MCYRARTRMMEGLFDVHEYTYHLASEDCAANVIQWLHEQVGHSSRHIRALHAHVCSMYMNINATLQWHQNRNTLKNIIHSFSMTEVKTVFFSRRTSYQP